jgi:hypothetical protein
VRPGEGRGRGVEREEEEGGMRWIGMMIRGRRACRVEGVEGGVEVDRVVVVAGEEEGADVVEGSDLCFLLNRRVARLRLVLFCTCSEQSKHESKATSI